MIRFVTSGESHGKQLTAIIEGIPAGLPLHEQDINAELARRQKGYGRGARMAIEQDKVEIVSGVRWGETMGSPITIIIRNRDWDTNKELMSVLAHAKDTSKQQYNARPGHADLAGILKYDRKDIRDILERASARETAARVGVGAVCKRLLDEFEIAVYSVTKEIGGITAHIQNVFKLKKPGKTIDESPVRTLDTKAEKAMIDLIDKTRKNGDTLGGVFTLIGRGVPVGLGSHAQWDQKLDGRIAQSLLSIQAVKGVSFGLGFESGRLPGSKVHDEIYYSRRSGFYRKTNQSGGFEGGMTTGSDIVIDCALKPIPSLTKPLKSVNTKTKKATAAEAVRSDVCVVPAAGVIGEGVLAFELARALKEKCGGDSLKEMRRNYKGYIQQIKSY